MSGAEPRFEDYREHAQALLEAALAAADPAKALARFWRDEDHPREVVLLAVGKGSRSMALEALRRLDGRCKRGIVTAPPEQADGAAFAGFPVQVMACDHPVPTERNVAAAWAVRELVAGVRPDQTLVCLLTGGGSAHLTLPAGDLTFREIAECTRLLQRAGADISELNCVRKHCEQLKGGRLAALCAGRVVSYILSDVIGNRLDVIASGPTVPDPTSYLDAMRVLDAKVAVQCRAIHDHLARGVRGRLPETPKPGNTTFAGVQNRIVASNRVVVDAVTKRAAEIGFAVQSSEQDQEGDAAAAGLRYGDAAHALSRRPRPNAAVFGGETTVNVGKASGLGGPSQETALAWVLRMEEHAVGPCALLTFSTDGRDGPTDAAGAIVTSGSAAQARVQGLDPQQALANHDSYHLLDSIGALIRVPPTGTNLNHVAAVLVYPDGAA